jgi:hypothetical protein
MAQKDVRGSTYMQPPLLLFDIAPKKGTKDELVMADETVRRRRTAAASGNGTV